LKLSILAHWIGFFLFLPGIVVPQTDHNPLFNRLQLQADYARFPSDQGFAFLEVYYTVYRSQLKFIPSGQRYQADYHIVARIFSGDSLMAEDRIKSSTLADNPDQVTASQQLVDQSAFMIRSGRYRLEIKLTDPATGYYGKQDFEIEIPDLSPSDRIRLSDLETARSIKSNPDQPDKFTKNTCQVIPNPSGIYTSESPILYFYAEIHNLVPSDTIPNYRVIYSLLDSSYNPIKVLLDREKSVPATSSVEINGFNLATYHSGVYYLKMTVLDLIRNQQDSVMKKIMLLRNQDKLNLVRAGSQDMGSEEANLNASEYLVYDEMSESALKTEFEIASLIAEDKEKKTFKSLNIIGKRSFLKEFWLKRDNRPETALNEFRQDFFERVNHVNRTYGASGQEGWKTDRGRVYIVYGKPDELDRLAVFSGKKAYEQWNYFELEGGASFVFVDIWNDGKYILVHSTARNELHDQEWERWLERGND